MLEILHSILQTYTFISVVFTTFFIIHVIKSIRNELSSDEITDEEIANLIKLVYVEKVGNVNYLYDGITNAFITQAESEDEMWANAKKRFPDKEFIVEGKNGEAVLVNVKLPG